MKYTRLVMTLALILINNAQTPVLAAQKTVNLKAAGRNSSATPNTILNGFGTPKSSLGIDGDFYIDTKNLLIYGPKNGNKWGVGISLKGVDGVAGKDGKVLTSASTVAGPQGEKGDKGEKGDPGPQGPKGETGAQGPAGATGAPGEKGATGAAGVNGANGSNGSPGATGATGATGPQGPKGETGTAGSNGTNGTNGVDGAPGTPGAKGDTGATGATGPQGPKGETGTAGAKGDKGDQGISLAQFGILSNDVLSGNAGTSRDYSLLGNLTKDSYFVVEILFWAFNSQPTPNFYELTFTPTVSSESILKGSAWVSGVNEVRRGAGALNETSFVAKLFIDTHGQSSDSSFGFSIKLGVQVLAADELSLRGVYQILQVGSLQKL